MFSFLSWKNSSISTIFVIYKFFQFGHSYRFCWLVESIDPFPNKPWLVHSAVQCFENTVQKREIACNKQFLLFPHCFYPFGELYAIFINSKLSSANSFSLEESQICHFGKLNYNSLLNTNQGPKVMSWAHWALSVTYGTWRGHWFVPHAQPILFPRIDDSHCNRIHSPLTAVHCFDDDFVGK